MIRIDDSLEFSKLLPRIESLFYLSGKKILDINRTWNPEEGSPVFTIKGRYVTRGWTEWTQGFQFGAALLQFDAVNDEEFLDIGMKGTINNMTVHISHTGVHDHGFNIVSTYGNILRLIKEGKIQSNSWIEHFFKLALKMSGAVQASRWTELPGNLGYIYSFNGPHSLFIDTIRTLRVLALAYYLGHELRSEQDGKINLLERLLMHAETTARYNIYLGKNRDIYDVKGRVAHEAIFNINSGVFRCPNTQQGYSPFSTWTRGLAWAILGYAEQIEFLDTLPETHFEGVNVDGISDKNKFLNRFVEITCATSDFFIENTPTDGIPYWDTGAPGLSKINDYLNRPADPFNEFEPVDSSAASIAAQGLIRLGRYLIEKGEKRKGSKYLHAGLTTAFTLFNSTYLSEDLSHQGLILHSVYHRPNGWDYIPEGHKIPCGEATMWGDYHSMELALYIKRLADDKAYYCFFNI